MAVRLYSIYCLSDIDPDKKIDTPFYTNGESGRFLLLGRKRDIFIPTDVSHHTRNHSLVFYSRSASGKRKCMAYQTKNSKNVTIC